MALIAVDSAAPAVVPQGTAAWVRERIGCLTASNMARAMAVLKKGGESAERQKLKFEVLAERMTDSAVEHYVTDAMQWGLDHEAEARDLYISLTGAEILPSGFVRHPTIEFFGASPDGFIVPDGLIEIKCPRSETHLQWMLAGEVPDQHKLQMLAQLSCSRRKWVDFVSYDPRVQRESARIFIRRFQPHRDEIAAVEEAARQFLAEVEAMFVSVNR